MCVVYPMTRGMDGPPLVLLPMCDTRLLISCLYSYAYHQYTPPNFNVTKELLFRKAEAERLNCGWFCSEVRPKMVVWLSPRWYVA